MKYAPLLQSAALLPALALLVPAGAHAQTQPPPPPQPANVDENGVDVSSRTLVLGATDLRIGPDNHRGLQLNRQLAKYGWRLSTTPIISGNMTDPIVVIGGRSQTFHYNGSSYIPLVQDGSKLNSTATIFTAADGTVVHFGEIAVLAEHATAIKAAQKVIFPDGVEHTYTYQSGVYQIYPGGGGIGEISIRIDRLVSINSSTGYQLKLTYASNNDQDDNWSKLAKVTSVNNTVEVCDPAASSCSLSGDWPEVTYSGGMDSASSITDPEGRVTAFSYSGTKVTSITPPGSGSSPVSFTYSGDKVATVSRGGGTWTYGSPTTTSTSVTNPASKVTRYNFTAQGFVTSQINAENKTTLFTYCTGTATCPQGRVQKITSPEQNYVLFAYDARGNMTAQTHYPKPGSGLTPIIRSAAYPATCSNAKTCNKPVSITDANGNVTNFTWNATHGGLTKVEAPAPASGAARPTTLYTYATVKPRYLESGGTWVIAPTIYMPNLVRECSSAATCIGSADERVTVFNYLTSATPHNGLVTVAARRPGDSSFSNVTRFTYTPLGDAATVDGPLSGAVDKTAIFYNNARQEIGRIGPGDATNRYGTLRTTYDSAGRPWKVESGHTTGQTESALAAMTVIGSNRTTYDSHSRPVRQAAIGSNGTTYSLTQTSYDSLSRITCTAQRMNPATFASLPASACTLASQGAHGPDRIARYTYDALDRVTGITNGYGTADATLETATYTNNGLVGTLKDGENNLTTYVYDGHDRRYRVRYPVAAKGANSSSTTDYAQYGFDAGGNVTSIRTRRGETLTLSYDDLNRLVKKVVPQRSGLGATHTRDVYYSYDYLGNLTDARFDSATGDGVSLTYDGLGRPVSESLIMDGVTRTLAYGYDAASNRTSLKYPDNQSFTYTYGLGSRPEQVRDPAGNALAAFGYDTAGRTVRISRSGSAVDQYIGYDALSRLSSLSIGSSATSSLASWTLTYNPASQIVGDTRSNNAFAWDGHVNVTRNYTANGLNQYTSAGNTTFSYDANGNLTSDGTSTFVYDVENRLVTRSGSSTTTTLRYDPLGRLYEVSDSQAGLTRFLYSGDALVAEYSGSGTMLQRHVHGSAIGSDDPLVSYTGTSVAIGNARFLYADARGSIVYSANATGGSAQINSYDEYGIPGSSNTGRFQYTGQAWLGELGLYHYKARMYSPTLGRFLQTDPIGYADGMNLYSYVANDPVNHVDPTGLAENEIVVEGFRSRLRVINEWDLPSFGSFDPGLGGAFGERLGSEIVVRGTKRESTEGDDVPVIVVQGFKETRTVSTESIASISVIAIPVGRAGESGPGSDRFREFGKDQVAKFGEFQERHRFCAQYAAQRIDWQRAIDVAGHGQTAGSGVAAALGRAIGPYGLAGAAAAGSVAVLASYSSQYQYCMSNGGGG